MLDFFVLLYADVSVAARLTVTIRVKMKTADSSNRCLFFIAMASVSVWDVSITIDMLIILRSSGTEKGTSSSFEGHSTFA